MACKTRKGRRVFEGRVVDARDEVASKFGVSGRLEIHVSAMKQLHVSACSAFPGKQVLSPNIRRRLASSATGLFLP